MCNQTTIKVKIWVKSKIHSEGCSTGSRGQFYQLNYPLTKLFPFSPLFKYMTNFLEVKTNLYKVKHIHNQQKNLTWIHIASITTNYNSNLSFPTRNIIELVSIKRLTNSHQNYPNMNINMRITCQNSSNWLIFTKTTSLFIHKSTISPKWQILQKDKYEANIGYVIWLQHL